MRAHEVLWLAALCVACRGDSEQVPINLCDGTDTLRLNYSTGGTSLLPDGFVFSHAFFMVDGKCRLFANDDPWQPTRVTQLTAQTLQELEAAIDIDAWPALSNNYCSDAFDGPVESYWIYTHATRAGTPETGLCTNSPHDIQQRARSFLTAAAKQGDELQGPVRYTLLLAADASGLRGGFKGAVPWPLGDVAAHLTGAEQTRIADQAEAATLRGLRASYLRGELGSTDERFIPVLEPNGQRYELRMRDVAPYGDESPRDLP